jgi:glycosyltransferase involved in cell wall biosynthesis
MSKELPLVSIVMAAYNRASTIERAVESVRKQTYPNIELIIIDDGSDDNTIEKVQPYLSDNIRLYKHEINRGVTAAKNSGLNQVKGEWFTILDSDDEIVPQAIERMMRIPLYEDTTVTAVTCNCIDTSTNAFSGKGLNQDQYLDVDTIMNTCKGEFWGITHCNLLQGERFNERLRGFEATLWFKIDDRAKRYYCHEGLRIYHTEGDDRIMKSTYNYPKEVQLYQNLLLEKEFFSKLRRYRPEEYLYFCRSGLIVIRTTGRVDIARQYYQMLPEANKGGINKLVLDRKWASQLLLAIRRLKNSLKPIKSLFKGSAE